MARNTLWLWIFALLLAGNARAQTEKPKLGQPIRDVTLRDFRHRKRSLADYRGKVVLVNFWASWCPPCRAEMPDLVKLQRRYGPRGLQIVGITYPEDNRLDARQIVRQLRINYPVLWGTSDAAALFDVAAELPVTIVIDRAGRVRERIVGILLQQEFEEKIKPLLLP
ncbi:MAG: TlpA disulfide reductase family protein [Pyrinomonadaceae bacterium]